MSVVTRFAPSPTGFLHIGGARTALFAYLYAKRHNGKFLLRIEDTDRERSTPEATEAILDGMAWLGLDSDELPIFQFARQPRHAEVVEALLEKNMAYKCYCTPEELAAMRAEAEAAGKPFKYDRRWRDSNATPPEGVSPAIRLKAPLTGETVVEDKVVGRVVIANEQLEDLVLMRSDGAPTYNLAVVVDDHDMGVTHVIRGDDHLSNTPKQMIIYQAMGWNVPVFAHIPMIHGPDGKKLSKRHGAVAVQWYREQGYLPEALRNYLLRLGWSHGDDEIISDTQARAWFDLEHVGQSPSRFDFAKLENLNGHYIRESDNARLATLVMERLKAMHPFPFVPEAEARLLKGMDGLKQRAKTIQELAESSLFYVHPRPLPFTEQATKLLNPALISQLLPLLESESDWKAATLEAKVKQFAEQQAIKLGAIAQPLRAALSGSHVSPGIFEVMEVLEKEETLSRLREFA